MKRNIKYVLLSCLCLFASRTTLNAQEQEESLYAVSLEPLYFYSGGLRLNVEKQLKPHERIELNLTGYYLPYSKIESHDTFFFRDVKEGGHLTLGSDLHRFNSLSGLGIGGVYKRYFLKKGVLNAGTGYTYYHVRYPYLGFHKYEEDGLPFYEYKWKGVSQSFHTFTVNLSVGIRSSFHALFFMESAIGVGYAYSFYDKDKKAYNENPFGFGYRGIYPALSLKLGFNIK
jgi:hypothetical protein